MATAAFCQGVRALRAALSSPQIRRRTTFQKPQNQGSVLSRYKQADSHRLNRNLWLATISLKNWHFRPPSDRLLHRRPHALACPGKNDFCNSHLHARVVWIDRFSSEGGFHFAGGSDDLSKVSNFCSNQFG